MKRFRKLLSAVLALTMILSTLIIIPATVHAETVVEKGTVYELVKNVSSATQGQFTLTYGTSAGGAVLTERLVPTYDESTGSLVNADNATVFSVQNLDPATNTNLDATTTGEFLTASISSGRAVAITFQAPVDGEYAYSIKATRTVDNGWNKAAIYSTVNEWSEMAETDLKVAKYGHVSQAKTVTLKKGDIISLIFTGNTTDAVIEEFKVTYKGYTLPSDPANGTVYSLFSESGINTTDFVIAQSSVSTANVVTGDSVSLANTEVSNGTSLYGDLTGLTGYGVNDTTPLVFKTADGAYGIQSESGKKTIIKFTAPTCGSYTFNMPVQILNDNATDHTLYQQVNAYAFIGNDIDGYTEQNRFDFWSFNAETKTRTYTLKEGEVLLLSIRTAYNSAVINVTDFTVTLDEGGHTIGAWEHDDDGHWKDTTCCDQNVVAKADHTSSTVCSTCGWGADYTATVSTTSPATVTAGTDIPVKVTVGGDAENYAAAQLVFEYDAALLDVKTTPDGYEVDDEEGKLTISVYGADKVTASEIEVVFTALAVTDPAEATVTLTYAGFSDKVRAETLDLKAAVITDAAVTVTIANEYDVTIPDHFVGNEKAFQGETYTFKKEDTNYDYADIVVKVGDVALEAEKVTYDDATGTWTVAADAVTGAITVTATVTGKYWDVALGDGSADLGSGELGEDKAQYMTPYVFYLKDNVAPSTTVGYSYTLTYIKVGGVDLLASEYEIDAENDRKITISGAAITGDVEIMVTETVVDIAAYGVTFTGANIATGNASATIGQDYTFTTTPDDRFVYTITYTVGGVDKGTLTAVEGVYTIPSANVTGEIVINITASVPTDDVEITPYLTLNGAEMFLIVNNVTKLEDGRTYFINGNKMFWSDEYNAYCYLAVVEGEGSTSDDIAVELTIATGENAVVDYGYDVNKSGKVDINDAQLVYNMYSDAYADITESVTVEKFLRADVAGVDSGSDKKITTADAAAIVTYIFANN